jgi:hypothetical protein
MRFPLDTKSIIRGCAEHITAGLGCGVDYRATYVPLYAQSDSVVENVYYGSQGGKWIELRDSKGRSWQYAHLNEQKVKIGQTVKEGDQIAVTGNTGNLTTGPHLHLQIVYQGKRYDPEQIFANEITMDKYNDKMIRNSVTGEFALVVRNKKFVIPPEPGTLALITYIQRSKIGNIPNVSASDWGSIPNSPNLAF